MHNSKFSQIVDGKDKLLVKPTSFFFLEPRLRSYVAEELPIAAVLHNDVEPGGRLDHLVHLDDVGVPNYFKNVEFTLHTLDIGDFLDFGFV